jgi:acetylornithine deacetylase
MPRTSLPVVIGRAGRAGGRRLILSGHLDVVPPGDLGTWTADPWGAEVRDGRLFGRGACDMKGGVASILAAIRALRDAGELDRLDGEVVVALVPSEEDGGQGTLAAIRAGVTGDLAIITEPSGLDIVVAHAGAITFRLTVPGRAAHASQRREGVSALDNLFVLVRALEDDETRRNAAETDPLMTALGLPYPTIIGIVAGGEWASTVLDRVVADGRYGVRLGQSAADAEAELRAAIAAACAADPFLRDHPATIEITGGRFGSARVPSDHPLAVGLADAAERVTGRRPALLGEPYGADMQMFVNVGGTPCVMFGPGDVKVAHSADESVPLAEVETCAVVLAAWVRQELLGNP